MWSSAIPAGVGVLILLDAGRTFGAAAFGGASALGIVAYLLFKRPMDAALRPSSVGEGVTVWTINLAVNAGLVALFYFDYRLVGSITLGLLVVLFMLALAVAVFRPEMLEQDQDPGQRGR